VRIRYFDTFDWRLYRKDLTLARRDETFVLRNRRTGAVLAVEDVAPEAGPRFHWDFQPGPFREALAPLVKVRALLHLVTVEGTRWDHEVAHPKSGQILRLDCMDLEVSHRGRQLSFLRTVSPIPAGPGRKGAKWISRRLEEAGFAPLPPTLLEPALARARIRPAGYSSRISLALEPDLPSGEAALTIAGHLLGTMKANLRGMEQDIDSEFLHDFRVAGRRTRSLLTLMKGVLPRELRREGRSRFTRLGDLTGPMRDLDVWLLRFPSHKKILPENFLPGLREIFGAIARRRSAARHEFEAAFKEKELQFPLHEWENFLAEGLEAWEDVPRGASRPIGVTAAKVIARRFAKLVALGTAGEGELSDQDLHRLRIECKKLRYALEFFSSLFPGQAAAGFLATLRKLQDQLGDHHDLVVQLADLRAMLEVRGRGRLSPTAAAAAGALMIKLEERKKKIRTRFAKTFRKFIGDENAAALGRITRRK
jgi:CHAD domain-containing protein